MLDDILRVESLEVAVTRRVEQHDDSHHFGQTRRRVPVTLTRHVGQKPPLPGWFKELAKVVYVTKNGWNIQERTPFGVMLVLANFILPNWVLFSILTPNSR
jgi:hypothetical protein